jgi:hypothetical protein
MVQTVKMASMDATQQGPNRGSGPSEGLQNLSLTPSEGLKDLASFATLITVPSAVHFLTASDREQLGLATSVTSNISGTSQYSATGFFSNAGLAQQKAAPALQPAKALAPQSITVQQSTDMSALRRIANEYLAAQAAREEAQAQMSQAQAELADMQAKNSVGSWVASYGLNGNEVGSSNDSSVYGY